MGGCRFHFADEIGKGEERLRLAVWWGGGEEWLGSGRVGRVEGEGLRVEPDEKGWALRFKTWRFKTWRFKVWRFMEWRFKTSSDPARPWLLGSHQISRTERHTALRPS